MSKPKNRGVKTPYAIYYKDGSYMIYDLTKNDYEALTTGLRLGIPAQLTIGFLATDDIRAIIEQRKEKQIKEEKQKPAVPAMSPEEREYLQYLLAGIDDKEVDLA